MRGMANGFPIGLVLWFITFLVIIIAISYMVRRFNELHREFRRITGLLVANGWDLTTGKRAETKDPEIGDTMYCPTCSKPILICTCGG